MSRNRNISHNIFRIKATENKDFMYRNMATFKVIQLNEPNVDIKKREWYKRDG